MTAPTRETIVALLADIVERRGGESYLGEAVTMEAHMLQAAHLAAAEGAGDGLVAAALLHDIGHYVGDFGEDAAERGIDTRHDSAGAGVLEGLFPPLVVDCVRLHVAAKRYLCAVEPGYFALLSPASVLSLHLQGGPMSAAEAAAFSAEPFHREAVRVRRWDEAAKQPGLAVPPFAHYAALLQRMADAA